MNGSVKQPDHSSKSAGHAPYSFGKPVYSLASIKQADQQLAKTDLGIFCSSTQKLKLARRIQADIAQSAHLFFTSVKHGVIEGLLFLGVSQRLRRLAQLRGILPISRFNVDNQSQVVCD